MSSRTTRTFASTAGRAAFFTSLGLAGGCAFACTAVHYRWNQLKAESAYIDIIRDGLGNSNYLNRSFVASQVCESIERRKESSTFRRMVARLEQAIQDGVSTQSSATDSSEAPLAANSSASHELLRWLSWTIQYLYDYFNPSSSISSAVDNIAFCRQRLETPEYLIPHYLRSTQSRFNYYATKKEGGKFKRMDADEFLKALLGQPKEFETRNPAAAQGLQKLFKTIDTNGDGELSLKEFSFFLTLLATPRQDFVTGFQMFNTVCTDPNGVGVCLPSNPLKASLSFEEFSSFMEVKGDKNSRPKISNALMQKLFGETGSRRCTAETLLSELDVIKEEVWRAEFLQYVDVGDDKSGKKNGIIPKTPSITAESFGQLIANHLVGQHLPIHIVQNIRRLRKYGDREDTEEVPLKTWFNVSRMMENIEALGTAVRVYAQATGKDLNRQEFSRAVKAANLPPMTAQETDLLFILFDANNNGTLSYEEFEELAKMRIGFHIRSRIEGKGETREYFLPTLMKCTSEALFAGKV